MKKLTHEQKQRGFFDLGISMIILLIGATTTAIVLPENTDDNDVQAQVSMTTEATPGESLTINDSDD